MAGSLRASRKAYKLFTSGILSVGILGSRIFANLPIGEFAKFFSVSSNLLFTLSRAVETLVNKLAIGCLTNPGDMVVNIHIENPVTKLFEDLNRISLKSVRISGDISIIESRSILRAIPRNIGLLPINPNAVNIA